ncbi:4-glucanase) [Durusdinium trenchii]|uniref:cellulase n=1 Tax=Durusdinium trenchii TaxID=1381693 RepID=A0ABP0SJL2_9DINO
MDNIFVRSHPAKAIDFPPLLDEFSRTLAAPYGEDLHHGSSSGRIASHLSPLSGILVWSHEGKCLKWRQRKIPKKDGKGQQPEYAPMDILEREFEHSQILPGSSLEVELKEAGVSSLQHLRELLGMSLCAWHVSQSRTETDGISDAAVAPINSEWLENVAFLVEADRLFKDLDPQVVQSIMEAVVIEMKAGYVRACKRAIADYIFKDQDSRERALVPFIPSPVPDWGTVPFEGIEGTVGGPPDEWRDGIEENRNAVVRILTVCNQSALRLLYLWYGTGTGYGSMLLVDLPPPSSSMVDIDHFSERQKSCCHDVFTKFKSQWFEEVCAVLREATDSGESPTEARFFRGVLALLSVQTRHLVAQSVHEYTVFFERFSNPKPLTPEEVTKLKDYEEREDAFLVVKLVPKGEEVKLKDSTERVVERVLRVFRDFVVCLNDIPSPESRVQASSGASKETKNLWGTYLEEQHVQQAEKLIERTVHFNMANASEDSSKTIPNFLQKIDSFKAVDLRIRRELPGEMRMQMVTVDCRELNETLRSHAATCMSLLLEHVAQMNLERNERCLRCPFPAVSFGSSERRIQLLRVMAMAHNRALLLAYFAWLAVCEDSLASSNRSLAEGSSASCSRYGCSSCSRCFNPGARPGVMCKGSSGVGYFCPAEPGAFRGGGVTATYACMDWTFGSSAMRSAEASFRGESGQDVYFGVGTYGISGDRQRGLGACYRLKVEGVDKDIIAQSINTGWDVDGNQFDLQIAAGGAGAFNVCAGSAGSMFSGGKSAWGCTYGGVDSDEACAALPAEPRNGHAMRAAGDSLVKMCQYSWQKKVRLSGAGLPAGKCKYNPTILDVSRVRCPEQLVQLTQLQRQDDPHSFTASSSQRPKGFPNRDQKCRSEDPSAGLGYCLTRMMDCRKPSGAFKDNVQADLMVPGRRLLQTCTSDGYTRIDVSCGCDGCMC